MECTLDGGGIADLSGGIAGSVPDRIERVFRPQYPKALGSGVLIEDVPPRDKLLTGGYVFAIPASGVAGVQNPELLGAARTRAVVDEIEEAGLRGLDAKTKAPSRLERAGRRCDVLFAERMAVAHLLGQDGPGDG